MSEVKLATREKPNLILTGFCHKEWSPEIHKRCPGWGQSPSGWWKCKCPHHDEQPEQRKKVVRKPNEKKTKVVKRRRKT